MYVYIESDTLVWTVGFYKPDGTWVPESIYYTKQAAIERVNYLNGGGGATADDIPMRLYSWQ